MSKFKRLFLGKIEVNKELKLLLIIGGLFSLGVALSNTFVNVYIWKQKHDFYLLALFNIYIVITQPIIFILAGKWMKQIDRIIVLRIGIFSLSLFYLSVLFLDDSTSQYVILLGILLGIGLGFYWLAFNVLVFEITEPETRDIFNGFFGLLGAFAGMIGPFFSGWLITQMKDTIGYSYIFGCSLGLFILAVIVSFLLKRRISKGDFLLIEVLRWKKISNNWKNILLANFFQGLREGTFAFLIFIWVYIAVGSEWGLGTYSLITSTIASLIYYLVGRFLPVPYRKYSLCLGVLLSSGAVWIISFQLTFTKLMIFGTILSLALPLIMVPFMSLTYDVIGKSVNAARWRIEYIVAKEIYLNAGRILSIFTFILAILFFEEEKIFPYLILLLGHAHLLLYLVIRRVKV